MKTTITYNEAIDTAKGLLHEQIHDPVGEANPEYTRGIVEIIADCFGEGFMDDRKAEVARDIGLAARLGLSPDAQ